MILDSGKSKSMLPLSWRRCLKMSDNSFINSNISTKSSYLLRSSISPSKILATDVYVIRWSTLINVSAIWWSTTFPLGSTSMIQLNASLSHTWFKEQIPFDNWCGSIGITRSTRYTLVPRFNASLSNGEYSVTYSDTSAICTPSK